MAATRFKTNIMEPIDPDKQPADHQLTRLPIVVQVSQLSLSNRSENIARLTGNKLGWLTESFYSPFFRIKVMVDVNLPLKRGIYFQEVEDRKEWLPDTYECLPTFCFLCGVLGYGEANCPTRYE